MSRDLRWAAEHRDRSASSDAGAAVLTPYTSVEPKPVVWLWDRFIPAGMLTALDGDPGLGKSTMMLDLAARLSRGDTMPDGSPTSGPAGSIILSAEDDPARVIRPRLDAAGADVTRIAMVQFQDPDGAVRELIIQPKDLECLGSAILEYDARLVIVDPFVAYLPSEVNANRDQHVRKSLAHLRGLAEKTGAAIVFVRHLRKASADVAMYRGGGSIGIIGASRAGLLVALDPENEDRRILAVTKQNLGPKAQSLAFRIVADPGGRQPRVEWQGESSHSAEALLTIPADEHGARGEAAEFLRDVLRDGPLPAREIQREASQAGISHRTLWRAKKELGVRARKLGGPMERGQRWEWYLSNTSKAARCLPHSEPDRLRAGVAAIDGAGTPDYLPARGRP
jgi:hypothetical protein